MTRDEARKQAFEAALLASAQADACPTAAATAWARLERELSAAAAAAMGPANGHTGTGAVERPPAPRPTKAPPEAAADSEHVAGRGSAFQPSRPALVIAGAVAGSLLTGLALWALAPKSASPSPVVRASEPAPIAAGQPEPVSHRGDRPPAVAVQTPAVPPSRPARPDETRARSGARKPPVRARPRGSDAPPTAASALAAQVALLDQARGALAMGRTGRVLSLVQRFHARFPGAALSADAEVLALEALAMQGAHRQLSARARAFLADNPYDPHAARVRAMLHRAAAR